uniref:Uncharacterized protein n=1 Tax=Junco hyemalis TaxID=40217 RepID=A0A8C5NQF6_JUNHY
LEKHTKKILERARRDGQLLNAETLGSYWAHYGTSLRRRVKITGMKQLARSTRFLCSEIQIKATPAGCAWTSNLPVQ